MGVAVGSMPWMGQSRQRGKTGHGGTVDPDGDEQRRRVIDQARNTDMLQLAGRYTQLRRKSGDEWAGPCPRCGGDDRFTVDGSGWFCRTCKPYDEAHGWYGPIDFVMWITGLDFKGAVGFLTGVQMTTHIAQRQLVAQPAQPAPSAEPSAEWRAEAGAILVAAQTALWVEGNAGAAYLTRRALEPFTWQAFGLGFGAHGGKAAIVMPWYRGGKLNAIRYRFLEPGPDGQRLIAQPGSRFTGLLFGGQALPEFVTMPPDVHRPPAEAQRTLVLCEGEINAMSIWQVAGETRLDVLSVGSESAKLSDGMIGIARRYGHCVVWMDKRDMALKLAAALPQRTVAVASPQGKDANDLLRMGKLGGFLAAVRVRACADAAEKEALLWAWWDAANEVAGIDGGTAQAALKLAGELGKPIDIVACGDGQWRVNK